MSTAAICKNCRFCLLWTKREGEGIHVHLACYQNYQKDGARLHMTEVEPGDTCENFTKRQPGDIRGLNAWMEELHKKEKGNA